MLVLCVILETNGVQCLYYVIYSKRMVYNACTMCYTWNEWCAMFVICSIMLNNACAKINAKLGVTLWQQFRAQSRSKHMYYLFALILLNRLSAELRAHFYDTIAQKICLASTSPSSLYFYIWYSKVAHIRGFFSSYLRFFCLQCIGSF